MITGTQVPTRTRERGTMLDLCQSVGTIARGACAAKSICPRRMMSHSPGVVSQLKTRELRCTSHLKHKHACVAHFTKQGKLYDLHASEPMDAVTCSHGARLSVEFTEDARSDEQAGHGARLELRTDDAASLQHKALEAGLKWVVHPKTPFISVQAPGGQGAEDG